MIPDKFLKVVNAESHRTQDDLERLTADKALLNFYARHEQVVKAILTHSEKSIACKSGCSYCCYLKKETTPVEAIIISDFIRKKFDDDQISGAVTNAKANISELESLSDSEQIALNQRCPFLIEDRCSIYEVRPIKCRNAHATDAALCKKCFDNPGDTSIPSSYHKSLHLAANGISRGFESALEEKYDMQTYELNTIFIAAFENPKFKKRYLKGKKALVK